MRTACRGVAAASFAIALFSSAPAIAEDTVKTGFQTKTFKNADGSESPYVVFIPASYDGKKEFPVILFLHGAGETKSGKGKGGKMPVEVGIGPAIKKQAKTFPFIVVIPRAEGFGWGANTANAKRALAMLDETLKSYKTDPKRVSLTGLSMGGMGTFSIAAAHPDRWAAIVPICGRGDVKTAAKLKDIPCWCFHGDADSAVNVSGSRNMMEAIKKAGGSPKYTEYPGVGHNSWDKAYAEKELFPWLLEQKKK
ncbi:MAG TPA: prolyl oligopeptidase family serine peptidase [Urbifossiella sp.]|nr:prolyl oligopeptidase family serine peptidase [Urbifossiella sp.]